MARCELFDTETQDTDERLAAAESELQLRARQLELKTVTNLLEASLDTQWQEVPGSQLGTRPHSGPRDLRNYHSRIWDRSEGRWAPFYETPQDLSIHRAQARNLATFTAIIVGAVDRLADYTLGRDWRYEVVPRDIGPDEEPAGEKLIAEAQRIIDDVLELNDWHGDLDREIHRATREDGDVPIGLAPISKGLTRIDCIDPEQIVEPANPRQLEQWLDAPPSLWRFGVHALPMRGGRFDYTRPRGYHVVYDDSGRNWDYFPANPSLNFDEGDGRSIHHIKRNVGRAAARGISDYWPVIDDLEGEHKLAKNTLTGASIQAAIAYIVEHSAGVTKASVESNLAGNAVWVNQLASQSGSQTRNVSHLRAGSRVDLGKDEIYHAGPMGTLRSPVFVDVAAFTLRRIGARWSMPEYMISGDSSNSNFASTLVSESPFVKARESDQDFFRNSFRKLLFKVLRIAWINGRLPGEWGQIRRAINISIDAPSPASRNALELNQINQLQLQHGIIDEAQWATDVGRDPDQVQQGLAGAQPNDQPLLGGNEGALAQLGAAIESVGGISAAREIFDGAYS